MLALQKPEKPRQLSVGDSVKVNLHSGRLVDATIKAVVVEVDGETRYQVDFERDRTAIIRAWQIVDRPLPTPNSQKADTVLPKTSFMLKSQHFRSLCG